MHARLSSKISVAAVCMYPKSRSISQRHTTSWEAWLAATNSAPDVQRETLSCRRLFQEIRPPFIIKCSLCETDGYGVATISRLLKIIGLFCRISSLLLGSFAKETYYFKEPTSRSHPISVSPAQSASTQPHNSLRRPRV